jgi:hypothetical protein
VVAIDYDAAIAVILHCIAVMLPEGRLARASASSPQEASMTMIRRRVLPIIALAGSMLLGACQNPDGSTDWGNTLALGAGAGLATALIVGAASDDGHDHRRSRGYSRGYGYDRGYGHDRGYGRGGYGRGGYGRRGGW